MKNTIEEALEYFYLSCEAEGRSPNTIAGHKNGLGKLAEFLGKDRAVETITSKNITTFLAGWTGRVTNSTRLKYHTSCRSLWRWMKDNDLVTKNIMDQVRAPAAEKRLTIPFDLQQVTAILLACDLSVPYKSRGQKIVANATGAAARDRAIIYLLLDSGIRASELTALTIGDLENNRIRVRLGKGSKERIIPISEPTYTMLWIYLDKRGLLKNDSRVFPITRRGLTGVCNRLERRSGVHDVYPHRFRHTFAINFLRNGGDIYSLQAILGHTTLDMVKKYLYIALNDLERAHARASVIKNWGL